MRSMHSSTLLLLLGATAAGCYLGEDRRPELDGEDGIHPSFDPGSDDGQSGSTFDPGTYFSGIDAEFSSAAKEFGVPAQILQALAFAETQWQMIDGQGEFDGQDPAYGVMGLRGEALGIGADLAKVDVATARVDRAANIRAGAALLRAYADELGIDRDDLGAWAKVVARFSGIEDPSVQAYYVHEAVYAVLQAGVEIEDLEGGVVATLEPMPDITADFDPPPVLPVQGPDYAGAVWRASPNYSSRPAGTAGKPTFVIIHTCEGAYAGCWGWLANSKSGVSAHYVVKEDGSEITQLVREDKKAWHIAAAYKCDLNNNTECGRSGASSNNFTIGIEHAGYAKQAAWNSGLLDASAKMVCDITKDQGIPRDKYHIVGHGQLQPYNRIDPGPNWPWSSYLTKVGTFCGAQQEPEPEPEPQPPPPPPAGDVIVDNDNTKNDPAVAKFSASGSWTTAASTPGFNGINYAYAATEAVSDGATFSFYVAQDGAYPLDAWWTAGTNRAPAAPFVVFDSKGNKLATVNVDQSKSGSQWASLGTFNFTAGWNQVVLSRWTATGKVVIADAIRVRDAGGGGNQDPPPDPNQQVTVDQLLALTQNCTQVAGTTKFKNDASGSATVPICQLNGAVFWKADADIDCDGGSSDSCKADPYYQSTTSAKDSKGKYVDAATVPFFVVPGASNGFSPTNLGIKTGSGYGTAGIIIYNGKMIYAPYADAGPGGVVGEVSQAAAAQLGIPTSPISGGVSSGVTYIVFTGNQYVNPIESADAAKTAGEALAKQLIANN